MGGRCFSTRAGRRRDQSPRQQREKKGHPLFDEHGKPVMQTMTELGFDEDGKKLKAEKERVPSTVAVSIKHGTLTVDGMTGKAALNYDIKDLKYIYVYVPWIGTTVVSNEPFPGATEQRNAFDNNTLTVRVAEHTLQLYSEDRLLGKKPAPAYVLVDTVFKLAATTPVLEYGPLRKALYNRPGAQPETAQKGTIAPPACQPAACALAAALPAGPDAPRGRSRSRRCTRASPSPRPRRPASLREICDGQAPRPRTGTSDRA